VLNIAFVLPDTLNWLLSCKDLVGRGADGWFGGIIVVKIAFVPLGHALLLETNQGILRLSDCKESAVGRKMPPLTAASYLMIDTLNKHLKHLSNIHLSNKHILITNK